MIGVAAVIVDGVKGTIIGTPFTSFAYLLFGIGGICGVVALIQLNAVGINSIARALALIPLVGFASFVLGSLISFTNLAIIESDFLSLLNGIAWIGMLSGMLVVAILTIAAQQWRRWRRFAPLTSVLMMPVGFGIGGVVGNVGIGGVLAFVGFGLLGLVMATGERQTVSAKSTTT